jgi:hypothetical protein
MRLSALPEPVLPAAWTDVLEQIQRVLADALQAADARALALEALPAEQPSALDDARDLLAPGADASLPCERQVAETDQALASSQEALDRWLATAAQVAQRLAEQASRAV